MDSRYHRNLQKNLFISLMCTFNTFVFYFILTNVYKYHIKIEVRVYFDNVTFLTGYYGNIFRKGHKKQYATCTCIHFLCKKTRLFVPLHNNCIIRN